jgi:hypothetical protein
MHGCNDSGLFIVEEQRQTVGSVHSDDNAGERGDKRINAFDVGIANRNGTDYGHVDAVRLARHYQSVELYAQVLRQSPPAVAPMRFGVANVVTERKLGICITCSADCVRVLILITS